MTMLPKPTRRTAADLAAAVADGRIAPDTEWIAFAYYDSLVNLLDQRDERIRQLAQREVPGL